MRIPRAVRLVGEEHAVDVLVLCKHADTHTHTHRHRATSRENAKKEVLKGPSKLEQKKLKNKGEQLRGAAT